ncbi:gamma-butyrobetaine hydroxylase-like domain-containing protein [Marinicellulosiphila megalodicopiae]|uniref:gamma-butyrobetaine hydroxylase-like domain-containing protein n=1 Tax=Marinicellulosiphila megalodicopiae TaxID=2724896 RepID=UPI003BAF92BF
MTPSDVKIQKQQKQMALIYKDQAPAYLSFEFLRVHSPSAEVRGHGVGQETLQVGKKDVLISQVEPSGNYGIKISFSDGHDSGIFSWEYLYQCAQNQTQMWDSYLQKLEETNQTRIPSTISFKAL